MIAITVANVFCPPLSDRVIRLQVTGTLRSPVVRVQPLQLLSQEAIRFFLNRAIGPVRPAP